MLLSALKCDDLGLSFAAVHDSFWTHAADIDTMNGVLRDAFVQIHSEDVIGRLAAEFEVRYNGCFYKKPVKAGTELASKLTELRKSPAYQAIIAKYAAGKGKDKCPLHAIELLIEKKRLRLLQSSDAEEVKEGRSMITPAALFEIYDHEDATPSEEFSGLALGDMSARQVGEDESADDKTSAEDTDNLSSDDKAEDMSIMDGMQDTDPTEKDAQAAELERRLQSATQEGSSARFASHLNSTVRKRAGGTNQFVWVPLTFPPVPKKGNFNVERLKESHYFFS